MEAIANDNVLIDGHRIAFGIHGKGDPLVLVHGTPSSSLIWRNVVSHLVQAGFQVHAFDLLGYGISERPRDPSIDTSITGQVSILLGLLAFWRLDKVSLVAHDIGGGIAQRLSIFHPRRVKSLIMIDVVSFDSYPSERTKRQMKHGFEQLTKARGEEHRAHFGE